MCNGECDDCKEESSKQLTIREKIWLDAWCSAASRHGNYQESLSATSFANKCLEDFESTFGKKYL